MSYVFLQIFGPRGARFLQLRAFRLCFFINQNRCCSLLPRVRFAAVFTDGTSMQSAAAVQAGERSGRIAALLTLMMQEQ